jgi:DNA-binding SARP family transcriptional activator/KaiC/GvpD/RAD55 family RecA-like ATPase
MQSRTEKQQWKVCLCGRMTVEIDGRPITPEGHQGRMLFAYLAANRSRALRRDELIDVVWASEPTANADRDFNVLMARLRRQFGADVVPKGEASLRLPEDAWVDLEVIEAQAQGTLQALEDGRPREAAELADDALALMDEELLTGFEGEWIDERRRELAELRLLVREASVEASLQLGGVRLRRAKGVAAALVKEAPYRESGHELLMRVHAASGNVAEANRVYHRLRVLLRDELGTTPGPSITELNERLLRQGEVPEAALPAGAGVPAAGASAEPPERIPLPPPLESVPDEHFVGRDDALARLGARWAKLSLRPRAVVLTGAPGIGKTRLAACFSRRVHAAGGTVLYGRCDEDPLTSYQPFVEALDHYAGVRDLRQQLPQEAKELQRLPGLRRRLRGAEGSDQPSMAEDRYALFEAIVAVFRRAAEERPLLLVIDDMHWADAPTFRLLLHLARSLKPSRCMLLMTSRDADTSRSGPRPDDPTESLESRLASLRREVELERLGLEGLDEQATAKLILARRGRAPSDVFARDLRGQTGGNPFFIEEALRSLSEREELGGEREPDLSRLGVPEGVEEVITRRLDRLTSPTSKVLARASVIGPQFTLSVLAAISDLSADAILDEIEQLIGDGLLVEVPKKRDHFAFSHALVRETQYARLIASRRARVHAQVALELERRAQGPSPGEHRVSPAELAYHFYEGRPAVDPERAAHFSIEAAKYARRSGAYEEAIAHYGRALELLESGSPNEMQICDLLLALGKVELRAGRLDQAQQTFGRAADIARRTGATDRLALAALGFHGMYTAAGDVDRKRIDLLEEAEGALGSADTPLRARVLARLADSLLWLERDRALELSGEALAMARRLGDTDAIREALGGRHAAMLHAAHLEERLRVSRERLELAAQAGHREAEAEAVRWYMADLCERGEVRAAKEQYARLAELARELRQPQYSSYVSHWACVFAQLHGRLDEAERLADEGYELTKRAGARDAEMTRLLKRFSIYREQRRVPELRPAVERFVADAPGLQAWRALGALMDAETGDMGKARAQLDRLVADGAAAIPHDVVWLYGVAALAETSALLGDAGEPAAVIYPLLLPYARQCVQVGMIVFWGSASRFLGLAATARRDWDAADRDFSVAETRNEEIGSGPLVARTLVDHADMLLRRGARADSDAASRLLARATSLAEPLGMVTVCRRAARLQAQAGRSTALA